MPISGLLQRRRIATIADLLCKVEANDWHGVADAAMDLREIDVQLKLLAQLPVASSQDDRILSNHLHG